MTDKEKAKAYDHALEVIEKYKGANIMFTQDLKEEMFPELAESEEDERIRQYLINAVEEQVDIHQNWKEKCLNWLKERGQEKTDWLFEKGKWYVKLCHDYDGDLRHFQKGEVYQAIGETCITNGYHHVSLGSWEIPKYFRPANKDEIPQKIEQGEDEKIREELMQYLWDLYHKDFCPPKPSIDTCDKWIAWLEKQGEQEFSDIDYKFIRMRETKPKDISEFLDRLTTVEQEFLWEHIAKIRELDKEEQKPEWSDEDKQYLLVCKNALTKYQVSDKWDARIISQWLENKLKSPRP